MRTYTINEAIEEMKSTVQVFSYGYGTWKVKANLGIRSTGEYVEDYFTTHDEEWKTGIFDGEKYNPKDFDEWYDEQCWEEHGWEEAPDKNDSEVKAMFNEYCSAVWSDSGNEDNYESTEARDERAARKIIESWVDDNEWPDNVVVTADNSTIYVLDEDEKKFAESETYNLAMLVDGRDEAFFKAFDNRNEEDTAHA